VTEVRVDDGVGTVGDSASVRRGSSASSTPQGPMDRSPSFAATPASGSTLEDPSPALQLPPGARASFGVGAAPARSTSGARGVGGGVGGEGGAADAAAPTVAAAQGWTMWGVVSGVWGAVTRLSPR
jgi:hypothetical protein